MQLFFQSNGKYDKTVKDVINKCARSNYLIRSAMNVGGTYSVSLAYELFEKNRYCRLLTMEARFGVYPELVISFIFTMSEIMWLTLRLMSLGLLILSVETN